MAKWKFDTLAIHAGQDPDPATGAVMTPIYQTSTFHQRAVGEHMGYEYSRTGNPTRAALEACIAALEGGTRALAFASGMAAADAVMHMLEPGDTILAVSDLYGGTYRLMQQVYQKYGLQLVFTSEMPPTQAAIQPRLIWIESPTNPLLKVYDIASICRWADSLTTRPLVCVDNTFATPALQQPLGLGADIVLHSTTKYLGGHSDVVGGALVVKSDALGEKLAFLQNAVGAVPGPFDCFLVLRGIKTLALRMERHSASAAAVAAHLAGHEHVARVHYPWLDSSQDVQVARRQMRSGGGMVSFLHAGSSSQPACSRWLSRWVVWNR